MRRMKCLEQANFLQLARLNCFFFFAETGYGEFCLLFCFSPNQSNEQNIRHEPMWLGYIWSIAIFLLRQCWQWVILFYFNQPHPNATVDLFIATQKMFTTPHRLLQKCSSQSDSALELTIKRDSPKRNAATCWFLHLSLQWRRSAWSARRICSRGKSRQLFRYVLCSENRKIEWPSLPNIYIFLFAYLKSTLYIASLSLTCSNTLWMEPCAGTLILSSTHFI